MASNPSYGRYISERTIYETSVGGQSFGMPRIEEGVKEPKPALFRSYAAPVERNPFLNIDMLIKPPIDATQEALNQYGREGYLRQALAVDKRIQEQQILQQSVESKVNAIVNDEYERRRAVKRGVYESIGMTPAEIDEKFASEVLQGQQAAVMRATTDGQVRDALTRYFTLRGGIVPAFLQPPTTTATGTNTATGMGGAPAGGLEVEEEDAEPDFAADAEDQAELGAAGPAPAVAPAGDANQLTPAEESQVEALLSDRRVYDAGRGPPSKETMIKYLLFNNIDIQLPSGRTTRSKSTAMKVSWADLAGQIIMAFRDIAGAGPPAAVAGAPIPAAGYAEDEEDDDLFGEDDAAGGGGGYGAAGGGAARPDPSLGK